MSNNCAILVPLESGGEVNILFLGNLLEDGFIFNGGWIYGGFTTALFNFDFFGGFHLDAMKNLLELLRFFPLLSLRDNF